MDDITITIIIAIILIITSFVLGAFWRQRKTLAKIEKYFETASDTDAAREASLQKAKEIKEKYSDKDEKVSKNDVIDLLDRIQKEISNDKKNVSNDIINNN